MSCIPFAVEFNQFEVDEYPRVEIPEIQLQLIFNLRFAGTQKQSGSTKMGPEKLISCQFQLARGGTRPFCVRSAMNSLVITKTVIYESKGVLI